jgi:hypothetical protein
MSNILKTTAAVIMLGLAAVGSADARGGHGGFAHHGNMGHMGPPLGYQPQQSVGTQFNNPGPQISVPHTGSAVDQLSPLMGAGQPDALGIR